MKTFNFKKNIGIFCGSKFGKNDIYKKETETIIKILIKHEFTIIYGGGKIGLMGIIYRTAIKFNGKIIGIIPKSLNLKHIRQNDTKNLLVEETISKRKNLMIQKSDILLILPGAYGTLDELFDVLTSNQLKITKKPIIIINITDYWQPLKNLLNRISKEGFLSQKDLNNIHWINKPEELINEIKTFI